MTARKSGIRHDMRMDRDVPIAMGHGRVPRPAIPRPMADGHYRAAMAHGHSGACLALHKGFGPTCNIRAREYPDTPAGSTDQYRKPDPVAFVQGGAFREA